MSSKLPCDTCGSSDAVTNYARNSYCFSCGKSTRLESPAEFRSYFPTMDDVEVVSDKLHLPRTMTSQQGRDGRKWLLQNGITSTLAAEYKVGFVAYERVHVPGSKWDVLLHNRVILPYYKDNELQFYQARATMPGDTPKYYTIGAKDIWISKRNMDSRTLVITEDIASAIRVSPVCQAAALCGTKLNEKHLLTLTKKFDNIVIWLDDDRAGHKGSRALKKRLALYVGNVEVIKSQKEPKQMHTQELEDVLRLYI